MVQQHAVGLPQTIGAGPLFGFQEVVRTVPKMGGIRGYPPPVCEQNWVYLEAALLSFQ